MTARGEDGSAGGLYIAAKGGHNAESHNHNDVGNVLVSKDGRPVIVDAGVETYRAETFNEHRYEIWTMQSKYHNVPMVNGVMQAPGKQYAAKDVAYVADDAMAQLTLDMADAYPKEAKLASWRRAITLHRGQRVEIVDRYEATEPLRSLTLTLLTPYEAAMAEPGDLRLSEAPLTDGRMSGAANLAMTPKRLRSAQRRSYWRTPVFSPSGAPR
jgi:hypothetical protein